MGTSHDFQLACLHGVAIVIAFIVALVGGALGGDDDDPEPIDGTGLPETGCYRQPQPTEE